MENISEAVIKRLPIYYRNICFMEAEGLSKITSQTLAERVGNSGVQVRQDFFACGGIEGYSIPNIKKWLIKTMGIENEHHMIVIGAGNLGRALISYKDFEKDGFFIDAVFDNNPSLLGLNINGIPILSINLLEKYLSDNEDDIAVYAAPANVAEKILTKVAAAGVKGVWNFAPVDLHSIDGIKIQNVHLCDSLLTLSFRINEKEKCLVE